MHSTAMHSTALQCTAQHRIALQCTAQHAIRSTVQQLVQYQAGTRLVSQHTTYSSTWQLLFGIVSSFYCRFISTEAIYSRWETIWKSRFPLMYWDIMRHVTGRPFWTAKHSSAPFVKGVIQILVPAVQRSYGVVPCSVVWICVFLWPSSQSTFHIPRYLISLRSSSFLSILIVCYSPHPAVMLMFLFLIFSLTPPIPFVHQVSDWALWGGLPWP